MGGYGRGDQRSARNLLQHDEINGIIICVLAKHLLALQ